jgi:hypothetical protein
MLPYDQKLLEKLDLALQESKFSIGRKEVTMMPYSKPEIAVLGKANAVTQGVKHQGAEPAQPVNFRFVADCELDE